MYRETLDLTWPFIAALVYLAICAAVGWYIAVEKGRKDLEGILLGLLLGPFGCVVEGLLPGTSDSSQAQLTPRSMPSIASTRPTKRCPDCAEDVWVEASICRACRYEFPPATEGHVPIATGEGAMPVDDAPDDAGSWLPWPPGQWVARTGWWPTGEFEVEAVAGRRALGRFPYWLLLPDGRISIADRGSGEFWVATVGRGGGAMIDDERMDGAYWATSPSMPNTVVLVGAARQPVAILRKVG